MRIAIATDLRPLSEAQPPLSNRVIKVSREEPIAAELSDGTAVLVTWIGERTATCLLGGLGGDVSDPDRMVLVNQARVLVDHEALPWVSEAAVAGHFMRGKRMRGALQRIHRCVGCQRTAGSTRFATPRADYCVECEGAGSE